MIIVTSYRGDDKVLLYFLEVFTGCSSFTKFLHEKRSKEGIGEDREVNSFNHRNHSHFYVRVGSEGCYLDNS